MQIEKHRNAATIPGRMLLIISMNITALVGSLAAIPINAILAKQMAKNMTVQDKAAAGQPYS